MNKTEIEDIIESFSSLCDELYSVSDILTTDMDQLGISSSPEFIIDINKMSDDELMKFVMTIHKIFYELS